MLESRKPKEILHSKRGNLEYLEYCRVLVKNGRVVYLQSDPGQRVSHYWNIPLANTTVLLLGIGTSITQGAVRMLCEAGVMLGFCGNGGTPFYAAAEIEWFSPQSEYRPTEYVQAWMKFWFDDTKRLRAAKYLQRKRLDYLEKCWARDERLHQCAIFVDDRTVASSLSTARKNIDRAETTEQLLSAEARLTKALYKYVVKATKWGEFTRDPKSTDSANRFLTQGNYLAYGQAATCLWCLGIPHGFAVMHGKTRRGALVFDVADIAKDATVLPLAFIAATLGFSPQEFRQSIINTFTDHQTLEQMFEGVKGVISEMENCQ
ncbi:type I-F CRISPR-associated endonuclease Cas1f [Roseiconus lacunae]|uniref:CRISPR-associated endonuclease Cas1 n=1 Tax=Roseiconus lacunae TaxID=2605694 RepID=A0ABT7PGE7_9BACT|nr:type I-F CRISPR-associated endonuclease Cas1f [Roseiconus lacunae]MCD0461978.1 type I-F CRISPR-associated endonuclease Cas1f [Roseiconus lacunae]MDM4015565.1 type I-F CRISPR-associated endonuclease Cas1f [Roseiconus lacunae]